jgi:hypothetical protein
MFIPCLTSIAVTVFAVYLSVNATEEMIKLAMAGVAFISLCLTLVFAPLLFKLVLLILPFVGSRFFNWAS